jgi:hypothetical protein
VNLARFLILTLGPVAVVAAAYAVASPRSSTAEVAAEFAFSEKAHPLNGPVTVHELARRCDQMAHSLKSSLPDKFQLVVRSPFILAGDLPEIKLKRLHDEVLAQVARALRSTYFEKPPNQPIAVVICSTEAQFRELAQKWDGHNDSGYHGYYQRDKRRILLDLEAGNGSLAHELTHALSQCDFEEMPEWFDEGLAALHEDATFSTQRNCLVGSKNWRCLVTEQALRSGQIPSLIELTRPAGFRIGDVNIRYATARSFCLFLQDHGLLAKFYKELRKADVRDLSGTETMCRVLKVSDAATVEDQFHNWLRQSTKPKR